MSMSGSHVLDVFVREDSFTKRALSSGCVERIAFFDSMAGLQCSRRPCVLRSYGYATVIKCRMAQKLARTNNALADYDIQIKQGAPIGKALIHREVRIEHAAHQVRSVHDGLRLERRVVIAR